jgi:hypothetical protein
MTTWQIITIIVGLVLAIPFFTLLGYIGNIVKAAKKAAEDWKAAEADGVITDEEKLKLADSAIIIITNSASVFQILLNLALAIKGAVTVARVKAGLKAKTIK